MRHLARAPWLFLLSLSLCGVVWASTALTAAIGRAAENSPTGADSGGFSGGVTWDRMTIAPEVKSCELIWVHPRSGEVFAFCNKGDVYHSTDDGQVWSLLTEKADARPTGMVEQVVLDPKNDLRMYASSMYGGGAPFVTLDGGKTWKPLGPGHVDYLAVDFSDPDRKTVLAQQARDPQRFHRHAQRRGRETRLGEARPQDQYGLRIVPARGEFQDVALGHRRRLGRRILRRLSQRRCRPIVSIARRRAGAEAPQRFSRTRRPVVLSDRQGRLCKRRSGPRLDGPGNAAAALDARLRAEGHGLARYRERPVRFARRPEDLAAGKLLAAGRLGPFLRQPEVRHDVRQHVRRAGAAAPRPLARQAGRLDRLERRPAGRPDMGQARPQGRDEGGPAGRF